MPYDSDCHHRRSIRLPKYNYSFAGCYFFSICVFERDFLLGIVLETTIDLTAFGHLVELSWLEIPAHIPKLEIDDFVILPIHIHGIIAIGGDEGTACRALLPSQMLIMASKMGI